jgi:serine/threonine protein kinase
VDALRWSLQIARALQYLHESQPPIVHRDVKLDNVLLTGAHLATADAKLADFGLARQASGGAALLPPPWLAAAANAKAALLRASSSACQSVKASPCSSPTSSTHDSVSSQGAVLTGKTGSYGYMAPEVLGSRPYGCSADTFSLGMCM